MYEIYENGFFHGSFASEEEALSYIKFMEWEKKNINIVKNEQSTPYQRQTIEWIESILDNVKFPEDEDIMSFEKCDIFIQLHYKSAKETLDKKWEEALGKMDEPDIDQVIDIQADEMQAN